MTMSERVMLFIDGSNLYRSAKDLNFKIDFEKFIEILVGDRKLVRPYYYDASKNEPAQNRFFDKLRLIGYEVKELKLRQYGKSKPFQKGVDVALVTDLLTFAFKDNYDTAILCSGDKDYINAVEVIKDEGKRVEVAGFDHSVARELKLVADRFVSLTKIIDKIKRI